MVQNPHYKGELWKCDWKKSHDIYVAFPMITYRTFADSIIHKLITLTLHST